MAARPARCHTLRAAARLCTSPRLPRKGFFLFSALDPETDKQLNDLRARIREAALRGSAYVTSAYMLYAAWCTGAAFVRQVLRLNGVSSECW